VSGELTTISQFSIPQPNHCLCLLKHWPEEWYRHSVQRGRATCKLTLRAFVRQFL